MHQSKKIGQLSTRGDKFSLYTTSYGDHFDTQVVFFHNLGEYHDRYKDFAKFLYSKKVGSIFIDMRGHGLSSGTRGHASSCHEILEDYETFFEHNVDLLESKDVFLCGHGLGALLCMSLDNYYNKLSGMILVNPLVQYSESMDTGVHKYFGKQSLFEKLKITIPMNSISKHHDPLI